MTREKSQAYRADIDGLRAIAVLAVVLFHFGVPGFPGGFVGVDVFFVVSGYLITRIIVGEMSQGSFSFAHFYERRARRLLPSLVAVFMATFVAGLLVLTPQDMGDLAKSMFYALIFASNLYFADQGGYFDPGLDQAPLLHTWSLAVEEQFYIVWPLLCVLVLRAMPRLLRPLAVALIVASLATSVYLVHQKPIGAYYLPHGRAWELLAGCVIALGLPRLGPRLAEAAAAAGLVLIGIAVFLYDKETLFPGLAATVPVAGTALLIWSGEASRTAIARLLSAPPLVLVGLVSYAWYLWHWPMIVLFRYQMERSPSAIETAALVALSFLLAVLSWAYLETPVRRGRVLRSRARLAATAVVASVALLAVAGLGYTTDGFVGRYPEVVQKYTPNRLKHEGSSVSCPPINPQSVAAGALCRVSDGGSGARRVLLWGDSHAGVLRGPIRELANAAGVTVDYVGRASCPPLIGAGRWRRHSNDDCVALNAAVADRLADEKFSDIVLAARWDYYAIGYGGEIGAAPEQHYLRDLDSAEASLSENQAVLGRGLRRTVEKAVASGSRVWLVMEAPFAAVNVPQRLTRALMRGETPVTIPGAGRVEQNGRAAFMKALVKDLPVRVIDPAQSLCDATRCLIVADGAPLYFDDNHLSVYGTRRIVTALREIFEQEPDQAATGQAVR